MTMPCREGLNIGDVVVRVQRCIARRRAEKEARRNLTRAVAGDAGTRIETDRKTGHRSVDRETVPGSRLKREIVVARVDGPRNRQRRGIVEEELAAIGAKAAERSDI